MKTIDINAKEWFDKIYGNSYFSADIVIDYGLPTETTLRVPFQYGYGDSYVYESVKKIKKSGLLPDLIEYENGSTERLSDWAIRHDVILRTRKETGCRKRDLYGGLKSHNAKY